jgi:hypothetical protein
VLEGARQLGADGALGLGGGERLPDLAEDLGLADDHRVEPGRDREQVPDGALVVVVVQVPGDVLGVEVGELGEEAPDLDRPAVEPADRRVDLHPVAGGQDDALVDPVLAQQVVERLRPPLRVEREPLEELERSAAEASADDVERHVSDLRRTNPRSEA